MNTLFTGFSHSFTFGLLRSNIDNTVVHIGGVVTRLGIVVMFGHGLGIIVMLGHGLGI